MYRCRLKKNDPFFAFLYFILPLSCIAIVFLVILKAEKNDIICLFLFVLIAAAAFVPMELRNARNYSMDVSGLHEYTVFHKETTIPWADISDVCLCCLFNGNERIPVLRFAVDRDDDCRNEPYPGKKRRKSRWLQLSYNNRRKNRIYYFEYQADAAETVQRYFPALRRHDSFIIWSEDHKRRKKG